MPPASPPRYAAEPLPSYAYVPGHGLPHPVNDPRGHSPAAATAPLAAADAWLHAVDLFNGGFYWEAHEAWEGVWNSLGRTTAEARFVQGLIHLAAAAVKIREGRPAGVGRHARRAEELLAAAGGGIPPALLPALAPDSLAAVQAELAAYRPECWHTSRTPVVRVLAAAIVLAAPAAGP
jgi:hypothetical protein